uniref:TonB-dependent receptor plug domain-containing protein n=1 Tax=Sphingomonas sp. TaxID=28214 RepID=UPI0025F1D157
MRQRTLRISLMVSASVLATMAMPALAQETLPPAPAAAAGPDATTDDIVVTGVRASIRSAQAIKRNATAVVDSIVAEDIGKLPDNTVSDALQRVTGIQVSRNGGEVNTVLVRGLP